MNIKSIFIFLVIATILSISLLSATTQIHDSQKITQHGMSIEIPSSDSVQWEQIDNSYTPIYKDDKKYDIKKDKSNKITEKKLKSLSTITFRVNKLEDSSCIKTFFSTSCSSSQWDFSKFESKNSITKKEILAVYSNQTSTWYMKIWDSLLGIVGIESTPYLVGYDIVYTGDIIDLDPALVLVISSNSDLIFSNMTEGSNLGARLQAAVLSMDFNSPAENILNLGYQNGSLYQSGTYIKDGSIYNNFGTSSGLTAQYWWNGNTNGASVINGSLQFDGVDDYVNVSNSANLQFTGNLTVCSWAYPRSTYGSILGKGTTVEDYGLYISSLGYLTFYNGSTVDQYVWTSPTTVPLNQWNHLCAVVNDTNTTFYINNIAYVRGPRTLVSSTNNLFIGYGSKYFNGSIDDVIIWGRALNATEISTIYSEGLAGRTSPIDFTNVDSRVIPTDNRVSYWSFNTNESGNASDTWSGFNGSCSAGKCPIWNGSGFANTGMYRFDGVDDFISVTSRPSLSFGNGTTDYPFSFGAWIYPTAYTDTIIDKGRSDGSVNEYAFSINGTGSLRFTLYDTTGGNQINAYSTNKVPLNTWTYVSATYNGSKTVSGMKVYINGLVETTISVTSGSYTGMKNSTRPLSIGVFGDATSGAVNYLSGSIDEVMIYNKTLNSSEVLGLYDSTKQILHVHLDELSGTTANGAYTLTGYPTTAVTAPIYNATGGPDGSGAYVFDGVDDYIVSPNPVIGAGANTVCLWINQRSGGGAAAGRMLDNGKFFINTNSNAVKYSSDGSTVASSAATLVSINSWQYICVTRDSSGIANFYVNGNLSGTPNQSSGTPVMGTTSLYLGNRADGTRGFDGTIDNIQIFNRALSASEVMNLYNGTLANRTIKYSATQGDLTSGVFYNSTPVYWNTVLSTADSVNKTGIVNTDNSINISNPNLVSYWALDGNYLDATGRNNGTGTTGTNGGLNNASGVSSGAILFDGKDDYVNVSNSNGINISSLSMWIKPAVTITASNYGLLFSGKNTTATTPAMSIGTATSGCTNELFTISSNSAGSYRTCYYAPTSIDTNWHNIIFVWNGTQYEIYLDNNKLTGSNYGTTSGHAPMWNDSNTNYIIGNSFSFLSTLSFNGTIDEVLIYNTSLSASQVSQLYKSGLSQHANTNVTIQTRTANTYNITDPSLVGFWAFNNDSTLGENATKFVDLKNGNNGTCSGTSCPVINSSSGVVGNGGNFNSASSQYINLNGYKGPQAVPYTESLWFKSNGLLTSGYPTLLCSGQTNGVNVNQIMFHDSWPGRIFSSGGSGGYGVSTNRFDDSLWHHVVVTVNSSNMLFIYVDGKLENYTLTTTSFSSAGLDTAIGSTQYGGTHNNYFKGSIDEVRIYNRSLSASEVLDLYNLGATHILWNNGGNWSSQTTVFDGQGQTSGAGKFMQMHVNSYTNTTDVSPYVQSYNISSYGSVSQGIVFNSFNISKQFSITQFVNVSGTAFVLGGNNYTLMGADAYYLSDYATNHTYDDAGNEINNSIIYVDEILDKAKQLNVNVIRTWGSMVGGNSTAKTNDWVFNKSGGHHNLFLVGNTTNYSEEMFKGLDYVIYQASKKDIRLQIVLVNNWDTYGGMRWWVEQANSTNKTWETTDVLRFHDQFYNNSEVMASFQAYINYTLNRVNTYSGIQYKNDPAIFAWLLANEPRAGNGSTANLNATRYLIPSWTKNMTSYIKAIDKNHLVGLGIEGLGYNETWGEGTDMIIDHNGTGVDFATFELHPEQWDYFAQRSENRTNAGWLIGGITSNSTLDWWTTGSGYSYDNRFTGSNIPAYLPQLPRHNYSNWVSQNVNWSTNLLKMPVLLQEMALPTNISKLTDPQKARFFDQAIYNFYSNGGDGIMMWNLNHDAYAAVVPTMDDGYSFYYTSNPILAAKSKGVIDAYNFTMYNNTGGTSWVTLLNNNNYTFTYNITTPTSVIKLLNCSLFINSQNLTNQSTGYYRDQTNTTAVVNETINTFYKKFLATDTTFFSYVSCLGNDSLTYNSSTIFTTMAITPTITLTAPAANYLTGKNSVTVNYTVIDNLGISSCSLILNNVINQTDTVVTTGVNDNFTIANMAIGNYYWQVKCTDTAGTTGYSSTSNFIWDDGLGLPSASLQSPADGTITNNMNPTFVISASDPVSVKNISFNINGVVYQNISLIAGYTSYLWSLNQPLLNGQYNWSATVCDWISNCTTTGTFSLNVDIVPPQVIINNPTSMNDLVFKVNLTETDDVATGPMWYYFDNQITRYDYNVDSVGVLSNGWHTIFAYGSDAAGNINVTNYTFFSANTLANQNCNVGYYQSGSYQNGSIICSLLPSGGVTNLYLYNATSYDGYKVMNNTIPQTVVNKILTHSGVTNGTLVQKWTYNATGIGLITSGVFTAHLHAAQTGGTKNTQLYANLNRRYINGSETLISRTDLTPVLNSGSTEYQLSGVIPNDVFLNDTDGLDLEWTAITTGGGSSPTLELQIEGDTASRIFFTTVGNAGPQGPPGQNGTNGATGPQGPQGPQGPAGQNGTSGSSSSMQVCKYKKLGYYNPNLPWIKQTGCV